MLQLSVADTPRMLTFLDSLRDATSRAGEAGPCGGFSAAYRATCDQHNQPCQEDVVWDVDTIYLSQDAHTLALADFDHLDGK